MNNYILVLLLILTLSLFQKKTKKTTKNIIAITILLLTYIFNNNKLIEGHFLDDEDRSSYRYCGIPEYEYTCTGTYNVYNEDDNITGTQDCSIENCPSECETSFVVVEGDEEDCSDIDTFSFWISDPRLDRNYPINHLVPSIYPNRYIDTRIYPVRDSIDTSSTFNLKLDEIRNTPYYNPIHQNRIILGLNKDGIMEFAGENDYTTNRSILYCGDSPEFGHRNHITTVDNFDRGFTSRAIKCNHVLQEFIRGPISWGIGTPETLSGRWHFRGMYNGLPEYVGGKGYINYVDESNNNLSEMKTDYYQIYYGPLRGGVCHNNDTGWQLRPIGLTIYDLEVEMEEKKRIESIKLKEEGKSDREIETIINSKTDNYWLRGPSKDTNESVFSFLRSLGWSRSERDYPGNIPFPGITTCNDFYCNGPMPARPDNTHSSLLCDDYYSSGQESEKEACLQNLRFFHNRMNEWNNER